MSDWIILVIFAVVFFFYHTISVSLRFRELTLSSERILYWFAVGFAAFAGALLFFREHRPDFDLLFGTQLLLVVCTVLVLTVMFQILSPNGMFRLRRNEEQAEPLDEASRDYNAQVFDEFLHSMSRLVVLFLLAAPLFLRGICALLMKLDPAWDAWGVLSEPMMVSTGACLLLLLAMALRQLCWWMHCLKKTRRTPEAVLLQKRQNHFRELLREENRRL